LVGWLDSAWAAAPKAALRGQGSDILNLLSATLGEEAAGAGAGADDAR